MLTATCWASAQCDGCRCSVLTTRVEQRQRFRQREGRKERSAVGDTVEHGIYRAQCTEGCSHQLQRVLSITMYSQLHTGTYNTTVSAHAFGVGPKLISSIQFLNCSIFKELSLLFISKNLLWWLTFLCLSFKKWRWSQQPGTAVKYKDRKH